MGDYIAVKDKFNPLLYQCKTCKTFLQSKYEGQFVSCPCGNAVDQTAYYTRTIAGVGCKPSDLEIVKDGNAEPTA